MNEDPILESRPDPASVKRQALRLVGTAARRLEKAERERTAAMRHALDSGASLREVADAAGLSHMGVKSVLERSSAAS